MQKRLCEYKLNAEEITPSLPFCACFSGYVYLSKRNGSDKLREHTIYTTTAGYLVVEKSIRAASFPEVSKPGEKAFDHSALM
jgi:hypothetical protein